MDYRAYLQFLIERGHNFIRLWRWEQVLSQAAGGNYHLNMTPQPWARTVSSTPLPRMSETLASLQFSSR